MNSTQDDAIRNVPVKVKDEASIEIPAPKSKRTARSRELAMLLENISNLAPSPVVSSDCDSSNDADQSPQQNVLQHVADSSVNGQPSNRFSALRASHSIHQSSPSSSPPPPCGRVQQQQPCDPQHNVASYRSQVGGSVDLSITGATGIVYGDIIYSDDSCLAAAAVHAGVLSPGETKSILLYILGPYKRFVSAVRNGIRSYSYPQWPGSFAFVPDALEQATAAAAQRKQELQERRAAKKIEKRGFEHSSAKSSGSDGSQSCSSSDSEHAAAHWNIPAVPEHLQALAEIGTCVGWSDTAVPCAQ